MNNVKCVNCRINVDYEILDVEYEYEDEEVSLKYIGKKALCKKCGKEIIIDEIEDYNQSQFEMEYKKINKIITKEEIEEIIEKYQIGKRPLSLLLGLGEVTITRYLSDYVPTKKNSILLKKILANPENYYYLLMSNRSNISKVAFNKSYKATLQYLDDNRIVEVAEYIISKTDVTPKGLQKLLYYIQLFSMKFLENPAFVSSCKKWEHGPVFGKIYHQFKEYGYNIIKINEVVEIKVENELLEIVNEVIKSFGCYSANVLEKFTHQEKPWIETPVNEIIEKELMKEFVLDLCDKYEINTINDIKKYSKQMFDNYISLN